MSLIKTQKFWIYEGGDSDKSKPLVQIDIPTSCEECGARIVSIENGGKYQGTFKDLCHKHYGTYPQIWARRIIIGLDTSKIKSNNILSCKKCHNFYPYAENNQPDGTLICWSCRN